MWMGIPYAFDISPDPIKSRQSYKPHVRYNFLNGCIIYSGQNGGDYEVRVIYRVTYATNPPYQVTLIEREAYDWGHIPGEPYETNPRFINVPESIRKKITPPN